MMHRDATHRTGRYNVKASNITTPGLVAELRDISERTTEVLDES